ncbi:MAG: metal-dependent hydrolase [Syntrophobacterales bacterium]|nr:metal-dependent hydrolase [Syntrophobacterales bacterium]
MKAINHRISAASLLLITGGSLLEVCYSFLLGSIPDQIERIGSKRIASHRGFSHDIGLWLALTLFVILSPFSPRELISFPYNHLDKIFHFRTWVLFIPGLLHCLLDLFTPKGVPFMGIRVSLPIFSYGTWKEYVFSWGLLLVALVIHAEKLGSIVVAVRKRIGLP